METSSNGHFSFRALPPEEFEAILSRRAGETKLGEVLASQWQDARCRYVVLGICEDIGPRANLGQAGARHGFDAFLPHFLNLSANRFVVPGSVHLLGRIDPKDHADGADVATLREHVAELDTFVQQVVQPVMAAGKVPIVIGGGHNNAYPLIKAASAVHGGAVDVINLDPHADCRALEGRHSGNSFSYALAEKLIDRYTVYGLHMARNNEAILKFLDDLRADYSFFEDYIDVPRDFDSDMNACGKVLVGQPICVELDLDSIKDMPSSARSPTGMSIEQARCYLRAATGANRIAPAPRPLVLYVHLPEGAPRTAEERATVGKTLACLVHDVVAVREEP